MESPTYFMMNEKHLSLFVALSSKPIRCRRRDWLLTHRSFRTLLLSRLRRVSRLYTSLSATPAYCSPSWNRTTNISLEVRSYIHLTNRPIADGTGLEPATFGVTSRHSNQLNYPSIEPKIRIELTTY